MNHTNTEITSSVKVPQSESGDNVTIPVFENCFQQTLSRPHSLITSCNNTGCKFVSKPYGFLNPDNNNKKLYSGIDQAYDQKVEKYRETMEPTRTNYNYNFAGKYPIGSKVSKDVPIQNLEGLYVMSNSVIERYTNISSSVGLSRCLMDQRMLMAKIKDRVLRKSSTVDEKITEYKNVILPFTKKYKVINCRTTAPTEGNEPINKMAKLQHKYADDLEQISRLFEQAMTGSDEEKHKHIDKVGHILKCRVVFAKGDKEKFTIGDKEFDNTKTIMVIVFVILLIVMFWFIYKSYKKTTAYKKELETTPSNIEV